jgi:endonuclease/exonuclease/phosphatase family metal-dependent hydrolase
MKKGYRIIIKALTGTFLLVLFTILAAVLYLTTSYKEIPQYQVVGVKNIPAVKTVPGREFTLLTWNIGYGGLGSEMDFFYEGGKRVRPEKAEFQNYLNGIREFIRAQDTADFILLQETDLRAKRSYYVNEPEEIGDDLKRHCYSIGENYDSRFVPFPLDDPMGPVKSGIVTFSRIFPVKAERIGFGTKFSWPKQLFFLQRCFLVFRFHTGSGKELVLINTHNSTFDKGGELRKEELEKLRTFMNGEYMKGNFVIAGGDWNNNPVGFSPAKISSGDGVKTIDPPIPSSYLPGWKFVFDPANPTNRDVDGPYRKGRTNTTIIDFFILSPNVELLSVKTFATGFQFSDHQPVMMRVRIK